ncbi:transglycosylase [Tieghemiomyces parasiticus]|uniref:Transglycosylase n=1 Tax=Tieghemiomyces parasiticus TaxID=78921 RepID=A0A9W7ZZX8_9FUNG|nr:transglycosylase [Tieghemiomyces parasiticus]
MPVNNIAPTTDNESPPASKSSAEPAPTVNLLSSLLHLIGIDVGGSESNGSASEASKSTTAALSASASPTSTTSSTAAATGDSTNGVPSTGITNADNAAVTCWKKDYTLTREELVKDFEITCPNNVTFSDGVMQWSMDQSCGGVGLKYARNDIWYGRSTITIKSASMPGAATAFIRGVPGQDEIDLEWVGLNTRLTETTYFVGGIHVNNDVEADRKPLGDTDFSKTFVEFSIDFTEKQTQWYMDGKVIRTLVNDPSKKYPTNARAWIMNVWDGGAVSPVWAGVTDWTKGPATAQITKLSYESYC